MKKFLTLIITVALSHSLFADTWYNDIGSQVTRIEQESNGRIWLMSPLSDLGPRINSGCTFNQLLLIPPAGREDSWLSMVLSAQLAKKPLNAYGSCGNNMVITATRLVIETE